MSKFRKSFEKRYKSSNDLLAHIRKNKQAMEFAKDSKQADINISRVIRGEVKRKRKI